MISLDRFKNPDGSINWDAYHEAERREQEERKAKGELCSNCGRFIVFARGYRQTCSDCNALDEPKELYHPSRIRCPNCGRHWRVGDTEEYELYQDGEHEVTCPECEHEFEISTSVSYTFISPKRVKESHPEDEDERERA